MKYKVIAALLACAMGICLISGCGKNASESSGADSSVIESIAEKPEEPKEESAEESVPAGLAEQGSPDYVESNPDVEAIPTIDASQGEQYDPGFNPQTVIDENFDPTTVEDPVIPDSPDGEGAVMPSGETVEIGSDAKHASVGEECSVPGTGSSDEAAYSVRVDSIELTPERNNYSDEEANVVKVVYTVTSISAADPVFVGPFRFRLTDENGTASRTYEQDTAVDSRADILPVESGSSGTFSIAFALDGRPSSLTLIFEDTDAENAVQYLIDVPGEVISAIK